MDTLACDVWRGLTNGKAPSCDVLFNQTGAIRFTSDPRHPAVRAFSLPAAERQSDLGEDAPGGPDIALDV